VENSMEAPQKLKMEIPYYPVIPLLSVFPTECDSGYNKDICTPIFIAALFTIAKLWKQQRCLTLMNGLRKCGIYIQWNFIHP
jgi:hypothetical protein